MLGLGLSITQIAVRQLLGFAPSSLFANGEQGVWYDPSDRTTLFQDSAGTTPVTAVEQPVGLMLDKSKGLVLGSELVTNGDFSNGTTGWSANNAVISSANGQLIVSDTGNLGGWSSAVQQLPVISGRTYKLTLDVVSTTTGCAIALHTAATTGGATPAQILNIGGMLAGSKSFIFTATAATYLYLEVDGTGTAVFDNISVRELPGNHAFQATSTSRPVLSARYNLLTKTEQFDDAAWTKTNTTATVGLVLETTTAGEHSVLQAPSTVGNIFSVELKANGRDYIRLFVGTTTSTSAVTYRFSTNTFSGIGTELTVATPEILSDGYVRLVVTSSVARTQVRIMLLENATTISYVGDTSKGIFVRKADLRTTNDAAGQPAYQRVNTATDYDTAGFKPYLRFDGTDDWLQTNSINFTATDKMTVFAGVRKLSDATQGVVAELSATIVSNNGAFLLAAPDGATQTYGWDSKGTVQVDAVASSWAAPRTNVVVGIADISGDSASIRVNGTVSDTDTGDQGTGNYGNYPLYIGRRGGATLPANMRLTGLIAVGSALTAQQIANTENWLNQRTGAF